MTKRYSTTDLQKVFSREAKEWLAGNYFGPAADTLDKRAQVLVKALEASTVGDGRTFDKEVALRIAKACLLAAQAG